MSFDSFDCGVIGPRSQTNPSIKLISPFSSRYQNKSKHPLTIVPAPIPRSENVLAEFARFSTHIHNKTVITRSHVWKSM